MKSHTGAAFMLLLPLVNGASWTKVSSPNFDLYTTATEREARETLDTFEQAREFFLRSQALKVPPQLPVALVMFDNAAEYRRYSPRDFSPAFFTGDEQRDYVVMSELGEDRTRAAIHEYVHVLVRHSGLHIPLWLNEGMADVYSTMEVRDGRIVVGSTPRDRAYSLTNGRWLRLPEIMAVDPSSPVYTVRNTAEVFYAQSWLLAHMLMLSSEYSAKFTDFVERVSATGSAQSAFAQVYGKSLAEIETAMNAYFRQSSIGGAGFPTMPAKVEAGPAQPADELEIGLILARLLVFTERIAEAAAAVDRLAASYAGNPQIEEVRGYLAWRSGDLETATKHLERAISQGSRGWKTYWDFARVSALAEGDRADRIRALRAALEQKPDLVEARLFLGMDLHAAGNYADAISELGRISNPDPRYAASLFLTISDASLRLGRTDQARRSADEARKYPRTPDEDFKLESLLKTLNAPIAEPVKDADDPGRPTLRRRPGGGKQK